MSDKRKTVRRIAKDALLLAVSLVVFIIEAQIPSPFPVPGVKLGLANIITVYAMFAIGPLDALAVSAGRILIGGMFSANPSSLLFSVCGGALAYLSMLLMRKILTDKQIWVCSVISAACHNTGQIIAASVMFSSASIFIYLPVLLVSAVITGTLTGLTAQYAVKRIKA